MRDIIIIAGKSFDAEIAMTPEEQEMGLMFRRKASPMAFPFEGRAVHKFWMKNTIVPLDIIFCKAGKVDYICKGEPLSLNFVGPDYVTDMVIELPFGTVKSSGIRIGDDVKLKYSINTLAKKFAHLV